MCWLCNREAFLRAYREFAPGADGAGRERFPAGPASTAATGQDADASQSDLVTAPVLRPSLRSRDNERGAGP
jgi:hypothetical protein